MAADASAGPGVSPDGLDIAADTSDEPQLRALVRAPQAQRRTLSAALLMSQSAPRSASCRDAPAAGGLVTSTWNGRLVSGPVGTTMMCCLPASVLSTGPSTSR